MFDSRESGILVHPTSFPGEYGIGDFGGGAYEFIDFLKKSNQRLWQILPLTPTSSGNSPYSSFSSFAGNYILISPDILIKKNLLTKYDTLHEEFNDRKVNYDKVISFKNSIYRIAFENFKKTNKPNYTEFCESNSYWLDDYCIFISLKNYFSENRKSDKSDLFEFENKFSGKLKKFEIQDYYMGGSWISWPKGLKNRNASEIEKYKKILADEVDYNKFLQFEFFEQWTSLKKYANENNIRIIGDLPIFVAYDSCDVWVNKNIFQLDEDFLPVKVAGVPPDYFSKTGQLWGNPLYDWQANQDLKYGWWIKRIEHNFKLYDILRIDHFRGFESYWEVPLGSENAINGEWAKGPRQAFFNAVKKALGEKAIIAEDLGLMTPAVEELRCELGLPGMKILQFAFGKDRKNAYLPHNLKDPKTVIYTGTHDNDTCFGWYEKADEDAKHYYRKYLNVSGEDVAWDFIRMAFNSIANFAIIPIQDIMSLGTEDRMNIPGTCSGNWEFRYTHEMLSKDYQFFVDRLNEYNEFFNRNI